VINNRIPPDPLFILIRDRMREDAEAAMNDRAASDPGSGGHIVPAAHLGGPAHNGTRHPLRTGRRRSLRVLVAA